MAGPGTLQENQQIANCLPPSGVTDDDTWLCARSAVNSRINILNYKQFNGWAKFTNIPLVSVRENLKRFMTTTGDEGRPFSPHIQEEDAPLPLKECFTFDV